MYMYMCTTCFMHVHVHVYLEVHVACAFELYREGGSKGVMYQWSGVFHQRVVGCGNG